MTTDFESSIRRLAEQRRKALAAMNGEPAMLVPDITGKPSAYSPPAAVAVPNVIAPPSAYSPTAAPTISLPAEPKPTRMPMAELSYLRGNPQVTQEMRPAAQAATNNARAARNVGAVIAPSLARPAPPRPTTAMMEPPAAPEPTLQERFLEAATTPPGQGPSRPPAPAAPQGPTIDEQVQRLVNAGMDPAEARRISVRKEQVSGPMPAGLWAQYNSPEGIRDLKARIAGLKATEARQAAFEENYNLATGAPNKPTAPEASKGEEGWGESREWAGPWGGVVAAREAAAAERWEQRGEQMADRRRFEEQIAAKEKERRDAMDPAVREQMDADRQRKLELNRLYQQYKKDILAHERDEVDFASYAKNNGFDGDFSPGEADRYVGRSNTDGEKADLRRQRQAVVMQNSMERAGNGHILPQRTLDNPDSTPNMRRAAYMTLSRVNPHMADEYLRLAALESGEINAKTEAQAAADLARFNNPPKPAPPVVDIPQVAVDVANAAPAGSDRHAVITATAAQMPGETPEEREVAATSAVDSVMWNRHASGDVEPGDWAYGPMMEMIYPLKDGVPSDKPISEQQFVRLAMMKSRVAAEQARAIYQYMTTGTRPGDVPNNHAPVGAPDTDVAAVE